MPKHKHVTTCLRGGGPLSDRCSCQHCNLSVCDICGAYEGGLTTDCPGTVVSYDRQKEVYETNLDFTDDRGWHQGEPMEKRKWHFLETKLPPVERNADPRMKIASTIDWEVVDYHNALQHELTKKAIAWVLADRLCEEKSADLSRIEEATREAVRTLSESTQKELLEKHSVLEQAKIDFRVADQRAQKADDEFRQVARTIVGSLERRKTVPAYPGTIQCVCGVQFESRRQAMAHAKERLHQVRGLFFYERLEVEEHFHACGICTHLPHSLEGGAVTTCAATNPVTKKDD